MKCTYIGWKTIGGIGEVRQKRGSSLSNLNSSQNGDNAKIPKAKGKQRVNKNKIHAIYPALGVKWQEIKR